MIAARLATLKKGDVASQRGGGEISPPSIQETADMLNINRSTVINAKKVLSDGTFEEIAAVENGKAAVSTIAKLATMRPGTRTDLQPLADWREVTKNEAAQLLNVGERSVSPGVPYRVALPQRTQPAPNPTVGQVDNNFAQAARVQCFFG